MLGCGEYLEIMMFVGKMVDFEMLGNMIDLCLVGVLISKLFCYSVCIWELLCCKLVSLYDFVGVNFVV